MSEVPHLFRKYLCRRHLGVRRLDGALVFVLGVIPTFWTGRARPFSNTLAQRNGTPITCDLFCAASKITNLKRAMHRRKCSPWLPLSE
jgi:hypothetical protein